MKKELEEKIYVNTLLGLSNIFGNDDSITKNYYDCCNYLENIINMISDDSSIWILGEINKLYECYQNKL